MSEKEVKNLEEIFDAKIARDEKIEPKDWNGKREMRLSKKPEPFAPNYFNIQNLLLLYLLLVRLDSLKPILLLLRVRLKRNLLSFRLLLL